MTEQITREPLPIEEGYTEPQQTATGEPSEIVSLNEGEPYAEDVPAGEYPEEELLGNTEQTQPSDDTHADTEEDYAALAARDLAELTEKFPEARQLSSIAQLPNALRYAQLRDLGLSPTEAYLATGRIKAPADNRAHLHSRVPRGSSDAGKDMRASELSSARELFSSLSDDEIRRLYKRVVG